MTTEAYEGWAMLELMGHRQRIGIIKEVEAYGGKMLRIDIPLKDFSGENSEFASEFYGIASVYALRPISEEIARDYVKRSGDPRPVRPVDYRIEDKSRAVAQDDCMGDDDQVF